MSEKIILVHDSAVYDALRKQARINRRVKIFMALTTIFAFMVTRDRIERNKKAQEDMEAEKE